MVELLRISIADAAREQDVIEAVCALNGYQEHVIDPADPTRMVPNPMTRKRFVKEWIVQRLMGQVQEYRAGRAQARAREAAISAVNDEIKLT